MNLFNQYHSLARTYVLCSTASTAVQQRPRKVITWSRYSDLGVALKAALTRREVTEGEIAETLRRLPLHLAATLPMAHGVTGIYPKCSTLKLTFAFAAKTQLVDLHT